MSEREISELYDRAIQFEADLKLSEAAALFKQLLGACDPAVDWQTVKSAEQGLRRIEKFRAAFGLSETALHRKLERTFRDYRRSELAEWEKRGWIDVRYPDGKKGYSSLNPFNLCYHDVSLRRRNERVTQPDREFAGFFLERAAETEQERGAAGAPVRYTKPCAFVFSMVAEIKQADLPPGKTVRAWFPFPLLCPSTRQIQILSVQPAAALSSLPDTEAEVGIAYMEMGRPQKGKLTAELSVSFTSYQTDFSINPEDISPYDEQGEVYRRFTKSDQHIRLTDPIRELAYSIVGAETNPYRKARKLYDWVCDNVHYNLISTWRESLFSPYGCASEDVRKRRVGDCLTQSQFYAALCRSVGVPAYVCGGRIFQPGIKNDHFWAEVYFPAYGWMPVDVTFSEGACLAPDLTALQRKSLRDYFFGHLDRYRLRMHRNDVGQPLYPVKRSPRRRQAFFTTPEFECGGRDVAEYEFTWECEPAER